MQTMNNIISARIARLGLKQALAMTPIIINPTEDALEVRMRIPLIAVARVSGEEIADSDDDGFAQLVQRIDAAALELVPQLRALADDIERKVRVE